MSALLDRRVLFDEKSKGFRATALMTEAERARPLRSFTWRPGAWLDQCPPVGRCGGGCVGFSWAQEAAARPVVVPGVTADLAWLIYDIAQAKYDPPEWNTPPEQGTAVLAGAKAAVELGLCVEFRWLFGLWELVEYVGKKGPAILGIWWMTGMMNLDSKGFIHATGVDEGGHAIAMCQVKLVRLDPREPFWIENIDVDQSWAGLQQSWGNEKDGLWRISLRDLDGLLRRDGEACVPVRRLIPAH